MDGSLNGSPEQVRDDGKPMRMERLSLDLALDDDDGDGGGNVCEE